MTPEIARGGVPEPERGETEAERIDRNWGELLQELRVTQTGVQILAGFLLVLPFQSAFDRLSSGQRMWYLVTVTFGLTSAALALTPVVAHRVVFRRRRKDRLLWVGDLIVKTGLVLLAITLVNVAGLVADIVVGAPAATIAVVAGGLLLTLLWLVVPLSLLRGPEETTYTYPPWRPRGDHARGHAVDRDED